MKHAQLAIVALVLLLAAGVFGIPASAADAGSVRLAMPVSSAGLPLALSTWEQANSDGFGDPLELEVSALEAYNGYLYAGTYNVVNPEPLYDGARIYRSPDGVSWTPMTQPGFQNPHDTAAPAILDFIAFNSRLYASTGRGGNAAQIWRSATGTVWSPMVISGFGDPDLHDIASLGVFNNMIYAGASSQVSGAKIYRSTSGDSNTWTMVASPVNTMAGAGVTGFITYNGALWATVESEAPLHIWRTTGSAWTAVVINGFGDSNTIETGGMTEFGGYLYVGAGNSATGAQIWRTDNDGVTWEQMISPSGFGDTNNSKTEMMHVYKNQLYASLKNTVTGMEVWRSADGLTWEQVNLDGFGDSNNTGSNRNHASENFLGQFYAGTSNVVTGGEVWRTVSLAPTDILLSNSSVDENQPVNTVVGELTAVSPDPNATYTFSLSCAVPGADDGSFNILGTSLRTEAVFDYETKSTYDICVRATNQDGLTFDKNFVISVNDVFEPITSILLSNSSVDENQPVNTVVGELTAVSPDPNATYTFSLSCSVPGADDGSFNILGTSLRTEAVFDYETKSTYDICVRATNQDGLTLDKNFVISVNDVFELITFIYIYIPITVR